MASKKTHSFKEWLIATRPWSFPASAMPILVTCAYLFWKGENVDWLIGLLTLVNVVVFHASGNCWSDYKDFVSGVDREDTIGGLSITSGEFAPKEIKRLGVFLMPCHRYKKIQKRAFKCTVWLSKWLSMLSKK